VPTAADYDTAAHAFTSVHGRLPLLLTAADAHSPAVVGGALRQSLTQALSDASARADWCSRQLENVVEFCRLRAAQIRELEEMQRAFDVAQANFLVAQDRWLDASNQYLAAPADVPPPGPSPRPPSRPDPPPSWAELRP